MSPKEAFINLANRAGESTGLLMSREQYKALGEPVVSEAVEDPEVEAKLKKDWETLETSSFVTGQMERLETMGGEAAKFAERARSERGYKDAELWGRASAVMNAIANRFEEVQESDLNLIVSTDDEGKQHLVLLNTGLEGRKVKSIFGLEGDDRKNEYTIQIREGDETVSLDTRTGVSWRVYQELLLSEKELGTDLPDSKGGVTVLTGEPKYMGSLYVARPPFNKTTPRREPIWRYRQEELRVRDGIDIGIIEETNVLNLDRQAESDLELAA